MATQNHTSHLPFLVFSSLNPVFTWRVVARETNRTISQHKRLDSALRKAERLNVQSFQPDFVQCAFEETWGEADGFQCSDLGNIFDRVTEREYCAKHFQAVCRG